MDAHCILGLELASERNQLRSLLANFSARIITIANIGMERGHTLVQLYAGGRLKH